MIDTLKNNPREVGYHEKEKMADDIIKRLSEQGMNYEDAYLAIKSHMEVYEEALSHLNHNAAMEMRAAPIKYSLN